MFALPIKVTSRTGVVGKTTGKTRLCRNKGCTGIRIGIKWSDGKVTYPCSKDMTFSPRGEAARLA